MYLPLRVKFAALAGGVAIIALGSSLWALSYRLERQMASRIADVLLSAESTFTRWEKERQSHLKVQARIIARDPRFFAAAAEGDAATTIPAARQFQSVAGSALFLVCDNKGNRLAHLDNEGELRCFDWPRSIPPEQKQLRWGRDLYLLQSQAITVGADTVGYVALGDRVDAALAITVGRIAGVDVLFFQDSVLFGTSLTQGLAERFVHHLDMEAARHVKVSRPVLATIDGERFLYRVGPIVGGTRGNYAVLMSLDDRLRPLIADTRETLAWVGVAALALAFVVSWGVGRRVTARVPQLVQAVEAVARGNYQRTVVHTGHDELRTLAQAVDRMRHDLAAQMEAIRRANAEKIAAERLAVIGQMASTVIHDFKTPMQVIRSAVELSTGEHTTASKRAEYAQMIARELDRMVEMTQELLAFARGDRRLARTNVDLDQFLTEAVALWRQICGDKGIRVDFQPGAGTDVAIDREKLLRSLNNIVANAIEALATGGVIGVSSASDDHSVKIRISDTGPGVPEDVREKIFEPFATFGKTQGTGLGLAMAKKSIDDHGGSISVTSAPGTGTTFTIVLPKGTTDSLRSRGFQQAPEGDPEYASFAR